ncbi:uncharacterized protein LOC122255841 [Penaeus japonicus]|uniref:uncharacterized protein LOC122255841 n=1 Tax=Penaeus japonicus TaxID=27405 RepID=UPI001C7125C9|nr:uncharacterized protein LOC122255841 [Penaeus japonicus]
MQIQNPTYPLLVLILSLGIASCAPASDPHMTKPTTNLTTNLTTRLKLMVEHDLMKQELASVRSNSKNWLDSLLTLLHWLGFSDEDLLAFGDAIIQGVEDILSQLPAQDLMTVEIAAGDILGMLQSGNVDLERLKVDLDIIYTFMWPHVNDDLKPTLQLIIDLISWLINHQRLAFPDSLLQPLLRGHLGLRL